MTTDPDTSDTAQKPIKRSGFFGRVATMAAGLVGGAWAGANILPSIDIIGAELQGRDPYKEAGLPRSSPNDPNGAQHEFENSVQAVAQRPDTKIGAVAGAAGGAILASVALRETDKHFAKAHGAAPTSKGEPPSR